MKKMKYRIVMRLASLLFVCGMLLPLQAAGQPPVDFAGNFPGTANSSAVIRSVANGAMAVASVNGTYFATVYLIDPITQTSYHADLDASYYIHDMRVVGQTVYFCGRHKNMGCLGFFDYTDLQNSSNQLNYTVIDINFGSAITCDLYRLAAYPVAPEFKMVAVGECLMPNGYTAPMFGCYDPASYYPQCVNRVIVEADINLGSYRYLCSDIVETGDCVWEVVESSHYVALIGYNRLREAISIHRCQKNNVLGTYYSSGRHYPVSTNECASKIKGCLINNDIIAIASLDPDHDSSGLQYMGSVVRTFDLTTMDNVSAQFVVANAKDEPKEIIYMPAVNSLVLLQNVHHPSTGATTSTFVTLTPYVGGNYSGPSWYHENKYFYCSIDRASNERYVGSGGDYWCLKNVLQLNNTSCYDYAYVDIWKISNAPQNPIAASLPPVMNRISKQQKTARVDNYRIDPICVTF